MLPHEDPLIDTETEESVLSSMMSGRRVESLTEDHFTTPIRKAMYRLLRGGVPMENLEAELRREGFKEEELYYPTDVWLVPILPHKPLTEAVAQLKRLALLRPLCAHIDAWRVKAPHMEFALAVKELGKAIRR